MMFQSPRFLPLNRDIAEAALETSIFLTTTNLLKTHIFMLIPSHQGFQRDKNLEKIFMLIKGKVTIKGQKQ